MKILNNDLIKIIYALNDDYTKMCLVSMVSIMENTKDNVDFTILYSKLEKGSLDLLNEIKKYKNCTINYKCIDKSILKEIIANNADIPVQAKFKALIPDLFPSVDKCIYFDCDILLNGDVKKLWNIDVSNSLCAVVADVSNIQSSIKRLKLKSKTCFNSGVMLFNLINCRKHDFSKKFIQYSKNNPENNVQDILNKITDGEKKIFLSPKFNYIEDWQNNYQNEYKGSQLEEYNKAKSKPLIIHFTSIKPYNPNSHHSMKELWWNYARIANCYSISEQKKALKEIFAKPSLDFKGKIFICYITNNKIVNHTITSLISVLENTNNVIDATIIDTGMSEQTKDLFNLLNYKNLNIHFVEADVKKLTANLPVLCYVVSNIKKFAPDDCKKIIYLSNGAILNGDIQELYNYDVSHVLTAVVQDVWNVASAYKIKLNNQNYFSCGVMLLNIENIDKSNLINDAVECSKNAPELSEQDILNKIINEDKILISPRYNYMEPWWRNYHNEYKYNTLKEYEKAKSNPLIIHYTGYLPDNPECANSFRDVWWKYLKKSPLYIKKLNTFRLNFYNKKSELEKTVAFYRNKFKNINKEISN